MSHAAGSDETRPLLAKAEEIAGLGSWRYDLLTKEVWWSQGMYRVFALDTDDVPDDPVGAMLEAIVPEDRGRMREAIGGGGAEGTTLTSPFRVLGPGGDVRWISTYMRDERDAGGVVVALAGVVQDVTDVKLAGDFLARDAALDRAVAWLSKAMVATAPSIDDIADLVLADAKDLTGSSLGLVAPCEPGAEATTGCTPRGDVWIIETVPEISPADPSSPRQWGWFTNPWEAFYTNSASSVAAPDGSDDRVELTNLLRVPAIAEGRFVGQIAVANAPGGYTDGDLATVKRLATLFAIALVGAEERAALVESESSLRQSNQSLERMVYGVSEAMGRIVEARDPYTQGHEVRVARLAKLIAEVMGLDEKEVAGIEMSGLVHDIGKLGVPAEILTRPGHLSDVEFALIKEHSEAGYKILKEIDFPWPVAEIVLSHHERWDGSGYPHGLKGDEIPLASRVLMVADVVEAMASHRPYRPALGLKAAVAELTEHSEKYDPDVVRAFMVLYESGRVEFQNAR